MSVSNKEEEEGGGGGANNLPAIPTRMKRIAHAAAKYEASSG